MINIDKISGFKKTPNFNYKFTYDEDGNRKDYAEFLKIFGINIKHDPATEKLIAEIMKKLIDNNRILLLSLITALKGHEKKCRFSMDELICHEHLCYNKKKKKCEIKDLFKTIKNTTGLTYEEINK